MKRSDRNTNPPNVEPINDTDKVLEDEDDDEAIRRAEEKVCRMKARKAAAAAKKKAEEEAARKAAKEEGSSSAGVGGAPEEGSSMVVEIRKDKGKGKAKAQSVMGDPDDGGNGGEDDDDDDDRAPCDRCRNKKISCQMQAGKRSSIICKPCHDAKVRCSYSGQPSTVKREGNSNPTGEWLAVLESQVAQFLADNRVLREGQIRANMYNRHMVKKLDWLMRDAKRRRSVDSEEEQEKEREQEEAEAEEDEPAPKKARSEKGKEREE
ncbi:hypothetical protein GG344DRAFT_83916 [Lentinula edodes]|nr:hypothetical protein GG344DRAFT_83916 [Lentinula edodes]